MNRVLEFLGTKMGLLACLALAALGIYLLVNHTGHMLAALPYLLLAACPLFHIFGHGHAHHSRGDTKTRS